MKNHLFKKCSLLLLSAFTLSSCGLQFFDIIEDLSISDFSSLDSNVSSSSSSSEVTSYTSGEVISANTIDNPIYVEDAIAKIDELGLVSAGDLSEYAYYLKGDVSSSTYVEKYDCFNLWLRTDEVEQAFQVYRAHLQPGLDTVDYRAPNALKDATVVVWGFLQNYNGTKELCGQNPSEKWAQIYSIDNATNAKQWIDATDIDIGHTDTVLAVDHYMTVTPVLVPSYANPKGWSIYYSSSDESIASINQQGVIRAISAGTAILSVTGSSEGKNPIIKTIFLTVFPDAIPYTNVAVYNFANSQITVDTAGVKSCAVVTDTLEDIIDEDNDERLAVSSDHVHYYNNPSHPNLGLICGLTSIEGKLRLNLIKSVHKVVLYAAGRTATDSFVINDSEKQTPGYSFQDENAIQRLVFFLEEGSKEINITSLNYGFISAIEFYSI